MKNCWRWVIVALASTVLLSGALLGQTVTNAGGKIQFDQTIYDFGKIRAGEVVKYTFVFTNAGPEALNITHVQPSCGCTAAADWTRVVQPGSTGSIPIQFNSGSFNGPIAKTINVTSSDKSQPTVVLQVKATVWRPVDVTPQFAVINVSPDSEGGSTTASIVNNTDEQIKFGEPEVNNRAFTASLSPSTNNPKQHILTINAVPPLPSGNVQGQVTIKTTSTNAPVVSVTVWANIQPALVVLPGQMILPAPPLSAPISPSLLIQNNSTNALKITEPVINVEGVSMDLRETQPGRQFSVALTFPPGFEVKPGQQVLWTAKSSHPSMPVIKVPITQMPRPITTPPPSPAAQGAAQKPQAAVLSPAQPYALPAVPAQ